MPVLRATPHPGRFVVRIHFESYVSREPAPKFRHRTSGTSKHNTNTRAPSENATPLHPRNPKKTAHGRTTPRHMVKPGTQKFRHDGNLKKGSRDAIVSIVLLTSADSIVQPGIISNPQEERPAVPLLHNYAAPLPPRSTTLLLSAPSRPRQCRPTNGSIVPGPQPKAPSPSKASPEITIRAPASSKARKAAFPA